jgi:hypothetical protein
MVALLLMRESHLDSRPTPFRAGFGGPGPCPKRNGRAGVRLEAQRRRLLQELPSIRHAAPSFAMRD